MDAPSALHPTDQTLSSFGLGKLADGPAEAVNKHLEQCPDCRKRVSEMSADSFLDRVRDAQGAGKSTFGAKKTPAPPPADTLPPGLADHPDYEIKRELGRGGMGVVYLAHNTLMGRDEVLKVMGRQIMERPGVLDRFIREIRAVAKLRHPNIVTAYSAVRLGESIVFAMEYVDGLDLSKLVKSKGPLPVGHACNFVYQSALGLQHAHEEGLVHRDIKPANLMLSRKGDKVTVKVLDFGLAKVTREEKVDGGLTSEGQALGTPDFIAPEQILDAPSADIRADIYSLGGTLYYLLTGRPPFKANSLYDMYQAHISRDADALNLVRPEVPAELAALVAKMMAKEPARRFQTPGEVAQALTPFFKKANAAFNGPKTDVSLAGRMDAGRPATGRVSTPTQPATDAGSVVTRPRKAAEPTAIEPRWESLIEFREGESSIKTAPAVEPTKRPPWVWPSVAAAFLFGLIALGVIVITIKNQNGETKVTAPDDKAFKIEKDGVVVENKPSTGTTSGGTGGLPTHAVESPAQARAKGGFQPLFKDKDMTAWEGLNEYWRIEDGSLIGSPPPRRPAHTFLCSRQTYRDFELRFRARLKGEIGNSGVQFRSWVADRNNFRVSGPQCEVGEANPNYPTASLVTEPSAQPAIVAPWEQVAKVYKRAEFNDFSIRCVGKHVTIRLNGLTTVDEDFPSIPDEGIIGWQLHGRMSPEEVEFKDVTLLDLSRASGGTRGLPTSVGEADNPLVGKPPVPPDASGPTIPADAKTFSGKRYKVFNKELSWHEARDECQRMGGHLAVVTNDRENLFVASLVQDAGLAWAWLGATDERAEGRWAWVDGTEMRYDAWDVAAKQPNNGGGGEPEHYLIIKAKTGVWWDLWVRGRSAWRPGFVCQWDDVGITELRASGTGGLPTNAGEGTPKTLGSKPAVTPAAEAKADNSPIPPASARTDLAKAGTPHLPAGVDLKRLQSRPGELRLLEKGADLPPGPFWPEFGPDNVRGWSIGDPAAIKMSSEGIVLSAGSGGNFLLTRKADYKKCTLAVTLAASKGAEAYIVVWANQGLDGWLAVTSPVKDDGGKISAGAQAVDFGKAERGKARNDLSPEKPFNIVFKVDASGLSRVLINGKETSSESLAKIPAAAYAGAAGLFLKSGSVVIERITVNE